MKRFLFFVIAAVTCLLITVLPVYSAVDVLTPHNFIATANDDTSIKAHQTVAASIKNAPSDTPYIERIELRAGLDDLDEKEQTYQLRFYPRAWGETTYSRKLTKAVAKQDELDQALYLCKALKLRYGLVLEYIQAAELIEIYNSLEIVYIDRVNVLQQKSATDIDSDISALIAAEDKLVELRLDLMDLKNRIGNLENRIIRLAGKNFNIAFDTDAIIRMEKIDDIIIKLSSTEKANNIYLDRNEYDLKLERYELELRKAQTRDYISFFQVSHSSDDSKEEWEEKTSVEIGIRLPFINSGQEDIYRRKAELERKKYQYEQEKIINLETISQLTLGLKSKLAQYTFLEEKNQKGNAVKTLRKHMAMEGADPLDLLNLKESILENKIRLNKLSLEIRSDFIELMDIAGRLNRTPLTDYLSNNLEKII